MNLAVPQANRISNVKIPIGLIGPDAQAFDGQSADGCLSGNLILSEGKAVGMVPSVSSDPPRVVMPALTEAHVHLDKCHTIHRMEGIGGDLAAALAAQAADKAQWTEADLRTRAKRGLDELIAAGCGLVRTHVDWGDADVPPLAWEVISNLATEARTHIMVGLAALTGIDQMADADRAERIAGYVAATGGALGSFLLTHAHRREGVRNVFAMADRFGLAVDFHVDEGLTPGLDGLEIIADTAFDMGFEGPVLCGHAVSLINYTGADLARVLDKVARAGLHVVSLPTTNLYLQGRTGGTPDRRGLTRLHELVRAGVSVAIGTDNVADAFCPVGRHDPLASLHTAILAGHLDPPFGQWLETITTNPTRALGRDPRWIAGAPIDTLRIGNASNLADLIAGHLGPLIPLTDILEAETE